MSFFFSTNNSQLRVPLREAVMASLTPDKGLFMPVEMRPLSKDILYKIKDLTLPDIAFEVAYNLLGPSLDAATIRALVDESITFPAPLVPLHPQVSALELFHGPTCAFKDFGARFMAALVSHFIADERKRLIVIVATSGDTGGAVANAFLNRPLVDVIILYPKGLVSPLQEKQFTTLGNNIHCLQIEGTFDACQSLAKEALVDPLLRATAEGKNATITSANSMNLGRLIPQTFYYFETWSQLLRNGLSASIPLLFSVPSGNFGNLTAGIIASRMGLPVAKFIAATNANRTVPEYLATGVYSPQKSVATVSNAMDVGSPNNFPRMLNLFDGAHDLMTRFVHGASYSDEQTLQTVKKVYESTRYVLDPHGAIGYQALVDTLPLFPRVEGVFLHTAHPAKFPEAVRPLVGDALTPPPQLSSLSTHASLSTLLPPSYNEVQSILKSIIDAPHH
jgi:threonine synthase